jgi:hypothetical protein
MVGVLAAALVGFGVEDSSSADPKPFTIHFTAITAMHKGTKNCPAGTVFVQGLRASAAAKARLCLLNVKKIRKNTKVLISRATINIAEVGGDLKALVRIVEVAKGTVAHRTITGIIYPGTGDFAKAGGRVFGKGTISFPKNGRPNVDLRFTFGFD